MNIRNMTIGDYDRMFELWKSTEGVGLSGADSRKNIEVYLKRNEGLSFVCEVNDSIVGTILCGHDGRRGYIHHLTVAKDYRKRGIGNELVSRGLDALKREGIEKCHIFVFKNNETGKLFWSNSGWAKREDLFIYSKSY